jgi:autotransporter translocation and assembly factor TamB
MKLFPDKKGMEMWKLVSIILVIILLLFVLAWYGGLRGELSSLLERLGELM